MDQKNIQNNLNKARTNKYIRHIPIYDEVVVAQETCGLLNEFGGEIYIGINENREGLGVPDADKVMSELQKYFNSEIIPHFIVSFYKETIDEKEVICINVPNGNEKPYVYKATIYMWGESGALPASKDKVNSLIENRIANDMRWERKNVINAELNDLDTDLIRETISEINKTGRTKHINDDIFEFLTQYNLYTNSSCNNACILLFGKNPTEYISNGYCRIVVFETDKTGDKFINEKMFEKNLFVNTNDIMEFFKSSIGIYSEFGNNDWKRKDYSFPQKALREAILNALIHRDYSDPSGSTQISIYPDRLEISNYGSVPGQIKIADLKKSHPSYPRNPDIAKIFFLRGWIEKIGRGTVKIVQEFKDAGLPAPEWSNKNGFTNLILRKYKSKNESITYVELNPRQRKILDSSEVGREFKISDFFPIIGVEVTDRSIRNDMTKLIAGGWFVKEGSGKNTIYRRDK
jgi:ATP-dependent DNA helicase RecG